MPEHHPSEHPGLLLAETPDDLGERSQLLTAKHAEFIIDFSNVRAAMPGDSPRHAVTAACSDCTMQMTSPCAAPTQAAFVCWDSACSISAGLPPATFHSILSSADTIIIAPQSFLCPVAIATQGPGRVLPVQKDESDWQIVASDSFRMSGVYWALTALALMDVPLSRAHDVDALAAWVLSCYKPGEGSFAPNVHHDGNLLSTLSAVQIMTLLGKEVQLDADGISACARPQIWPC